MTLLQYLLGALSGGLVGFVLGMVGGGGSILAVPLIVHLVGVTNPHVALGTSALAVAANAAMGVVNHARAGTIRWGVALRFAAAGIAGAAIGSTLGKAFDGEALLGLFALVMLGVAALMFRKGKPPLPADAPLRAGAGGRTLGFGAATGLFSGFFGIGGGFLVVPALVAATGMAMANAIGSSLVAITAFGATTAVNYALSGLVDWALAAAFVAGGFAGSLLGVRAMTRLAGRELLLKRLFASLIVVTAIYMLVKAMG